MRRRGKSYHLLLLLVLMVVGLGIGYALISTDLTINGTGKLNASSWNIYFDNLVPDTNNVTLSTGDVAASIDSTTLTDITYTVTLKEPGDFYEFTVDVVNDGSLDAMVGVVTNNLNGNPISATNALPNHARYTATYSDGMPIQEYQLLEAGDTETYKVRLEYRTDITASDLPSTVQTLTLNFGVQYVQADTNAFPVPHPVSFATDSWETIIGVAKSGNTSAYQVGDSRTIELGNSLGTHTLRIANLSTPAECATQGFSQTACGFVLEFADILTNHSMNLNYSTGNIGGWPASEMRVYMNSTSNQESIYNSFPEILRNNIMNTNVVSGHGTAEQENLNSLDKLYLLSFVEVYGSDYSFDTLKQTETRQMDYYRDYPVNISNYSGAIKQYNGINANWLLRSGDHNGSYNFRTISSDGYNLIAVSSNTASGVSPAFRIG